MCEVIGNSFSLQIFPLTSSSERAN